MPALDLIHKLDRLRKRLNGLKNGKALVMRDLEPLLKSEHIELYKDECEKQRKLKAKYRKGSQQQRMAAGIKKKREVLVECLEVALKDYEIEELAALGKRLKKAEIRRAKIFMDEYSKQSRNGVEHFTAMSRADNAVVRAGLKRVLCNETKGLSKRDKEVQQMEDELRARFKFDNE
jgi:hypothetical protein